MALVTDFSTPTNTLNRQAAWQQMAIVGAAGWNEITPLRAMIEGYGAELLRYEPVGMNWEPSWVVYRQGDTFFISLAGTYTKRNLLIDLFAVFPTEFIPIKPAKVHRGFKIVGENIYDQALFLIPEDVRPRANVCLSGHSLGGAAATYMAHKFVEERSVGGHVHLMTFASPRVFDGQLTNGFPSVYHRVIIQGDPVPALPPANFQFFLAAKPISIPGVITIGNPAVLYYSRSHEFQSYGRSFQFRRSDGAFMTFTDEDNYNVAWTDPVVDGFLDYHSALTYFFALGQGYTPANAEEANANGIIHALEVTGGQPENPNFLPIWEGVLLNDVKNAWYNEDTFIETDALDSVNEVSLQIESLELGNDSSFSSQGEGSMSSPPLSGLFKQHIIYTDGLTKFQERFYFRLTAPTIAGLQHMDAARQVADKFLEYRNALLAGDGTGTNNLGPGNPRPRRLSLADARDDGNGESWDLYTPNWGGNTQPGYSGDPLWSALFIRLEGTNADGPGPITGTRGLWLRGIPDDIVTNGQYDPIGTGFSTVWDSFKAKLLTGFPVVLRNADGVTEARTVQYGTMLQDPGNNNHPRSIIGSRFVSGNAQVILSASNPTNGRVGLVDGDTVRLYSCLIRDWEGTYKIKVSTITDELTAVELLNGPPEEVLALQKGKLRRVKRADGNPTKLFAPFTDVTIVRTSRKRGGGAYSPYQNKRRNRQPRKLRMS